MEVVKRFLEWIKLKEKLHINTQKPPFFREGEIWWCCIGENVGNEMNGKSNLFSRPIFIFKKLSRHTFLGIPTTSLERIGSWYVPISYNKQRVTLVLSQLRVLDVKRLLSRIGEVDEGDFLKIQDGFGKLYLPKMFCSTDKVEQSREIPE